GVASERSIATGIAEAMHREGAELAFSYQGEKLKPRVEEFAHSVNSSIVMPLDVANDVDIEAVFRTLGEKWSGIDIVIH
ncbi:SDR family oxidoreductase, partial [Acinetobacter baumannii]